MPVKLTEKQQKFRRLAEKRTAKVLDEIRKIGNLSSPNYGYDYADVEKIFAAIADASQQTRGLFRKAVGGPNFHL